MTIINLWNFIPVQVPYQSYPHMTSHHIYMRDTSHWVKTHALQNHRMMWPPFQNLCMYGLFQSTRRLITYRDKQVIVHHIHDTGGSFHTKKKTSTQCSKLDELTLLHVLLWQLCACIMCNKREQWWTPTGMTVILMSWGWLKGSPDLNNHSSLGRGDEVVNKGLF